MVLAFVLVVVLMVSLVVLEVLITAVSMSPGAVVSSGRHARLHLPGDPAGHGGWDGSLWARVRLVVPGGLHVRDVVWGDAFLRRVPGGDLWQDHEPRGQCVCIVPMCFQVCSSPGSRPTSCFLKVKLPCPLFSACCFIFVCEVFFNYFF